jgi:hypothetical protein
MLTTPLLCLKLEKGTIQNEIRKITLGLSVAVRWECLCPLILVSLTIERNTANPDSSRAIGQVFR